MITAWLDTCNLTRRTIWHVLPSISQPCTPLSARYWSSLAVLCPEYHAEALPYRSKTKGKALAGTSCHHIGAPSTRLRTKRAARHHRMTCVAVRRVAAVHSAIISKIVSKGVEDTMAPSRPYKRAHQLGLGDSQHSHPPLDHTTFAFAMSSAVVPSGPTQVHQPDCIASPFLDPLSDRFPDTDEIKDICIVMYRTEQPGAATIWKLCWYVGNHVDTPGGPWVRQYRQIRLSSGLETNYGIAELEGAPDADQYKRTFAYHGVKTHSLDENSSDLKSTRAYFLASLGETNLQGRKKLEKLAEEEPVEGPENGWHSKHFIIGVLRRAVQAGVLTQAGVMRVLKGKN